MWEPSRATWPRGRVEAVTEPQDRRALPTPLKLEILVQGLLARLAPIYGQLAHVRSGLSSKLEQVVSRDSDMVTPGSLGGLGLQSPLIHL